MCDYAEYVECSQQEKTAPEAWMEVCRGCEHLENMLENYKDEVYGVSCGLKGTGRAAHEIYVESELPEKCKGERTPC